jgi:hypothetical protein
MTALQVIIKEAKAIRKKMPKIEWKKAVAQASAIYASKHKGKSPVGKKKAVKKAAKKKTVGSVKKKAAKKVARKRVGVVKKATTMHKDTKSHNVNIRVMSGIGGQAIDRIKSCMSHLNNYNSAYKKYMSLSLKDRKFYASDIKKLKNLIQETKTHIAQLKKSI